MSAQRPESGAGGPASGADSSGPSGPADSGGERQVPFFCPYCGEEELRPAGSRPGDWECRSCSRGFQLRFAGLLTARAEPLS